MLADAHSSSPRSVHHLTFLFYHHQFIFVSIQFVVADKHAARQENNTNSTMNLDRAFVLLIASIGVAAGFTPNGPTPFSVSSIGASRVAFVPSVRVASTVFSEAEQAAEAIETVEAAPAAPAFETAIYVGNISFGKVCSALDDMSPNRIRSHKLLFYMTNKTPSRVTSGLSLLHTDRSPRFSCRLTEIRCDIRLHCTLDYHIHILIFTLWMLKHIPRGDPVVSHL